MAPSILRVCKLVKVKPGRNNNRISYIACGSDTIDANNNVNENE